MWAPHDFLHKEPVKVKVGGESHHGAGRHSLWGEVSHLRQYEEVAMSPQKDAREPAEGAADEASEGFTDEERAAVRARARELKAAARRGRRAGTADGESDVQAALAAMAEPDRALGERLHAVIKASAPALAPKTWYGM